MKKKKKPVKKKKAIKKTKKKAKVITKKKQPASKKKAVSNAPVFSGASLEEVGVVTHYFPHVDAAVVKLTKGSVSLGDEIFIKGHTSEFKQKINSIQLDHVPIDSATVGQEIGLKVKSKVRDGDIVYKALR